MNGRPKLVTVSLAALLLVGLAVIDLVQQQLLSHARQQNRLLQQQVDELRVQGKQLSEEKERLSNRFRSNEEKAGAPSRMSSSVNC